MIKLLVATMVILSMFLPSPVNESSTTYAEMGEQYYLEKDYENSMECFDKALELDPENICSLEYLGKYSMKNEDYTKAERYFTKLIEIDPENECALKN